MRRASILEVAKPNVDHWAERSRQRLLTTELILLGGKGELYFEKETKDNFFMLDDCIHDTSRLA